VARTRSGSVDPSSRQFQICRRHRDVRATRVSRVLSDHLLTCRFISWKLLTRPRNVSQNASIMYLVCAAACCAAHVQFCDAKECDAFDCASEYRNLFHEGRLTMRITKLENRSIYRQLRMTPKWYMSDFYLFCHPLPSLSFSLSLSLSSSLPPPIFPWNWKRQLWRRAIIIVINDCQLLSHKGMRKWANKREKSNHYLLNALTT